MGISHTTAGPGVDAARQAADRARPSVDDARAALAEAHRATDQLLQTLSSLAPTAPGVDAAALGSLSAEVNRAVNRLESARLRVGHLMAGCRERGGSTLLDEGQFFARDGQRDPAAARKDAHLARELGNGPVAPVGRESLATTGRTAGDPEVPDDAERMAARRRTPAGRAFDEGLISRQHVDVILATLRELPEDVTAAEREEIERDLTRSAHRLSPASLRAAGRRVLASVGRTRRQVDEHENDLLHRQEEAAWQATRATITHRADGTSVLHAVLPTLQAMALERVLQAMASPARRTRPAAVLGRSRTDEESRDQQLDLWHERGLALAELAERLPTDHLHQKVAATVVVHTDLETLRGEAERAGVTDSAHRLSAGEVRRIAAQAGIVPSVLGGESMPLDLGRQRRFFSDAQRVALSRVYDECAAEGCDRPFAWCQVHHDQPWAARRGSPGDRGGDRSPRGGPPTGRSPRGSTDLANAIPLCGRHNRMVEHPGVQHTVTRDASGRATVHLTRGTR